MASFKLSTKERTIVEAMRESPEFKEAVEELAQARVKAMAEVVKGGELHGKSVETLARLNTSLRGPGKAPTFSRDQMTDDLYEAGLLYHSRKIWRLMGAKDIPEIPDAILQDAHKRGGRVILRFASIDEILNASSNNRLGVYVAFTEDAQRCDFKKSVTKTEWIVVPSYVDIVKPGDYTPRAPAPIPPTAEDWLAMFVYQRVAWSEAPRGCKGTYAWTSQPDVVVGECQGNIFIRRASAYPREVAERIGTARFEGTPPKATASITFRAR